VSDLSPFFKPRSIAVIGASRSPRKVGYVLLDNLQRGRCQSILYPVNPNAQTILGLRCYPAVADLPETPELAIISVPATAAASALNQVGRRGTRAAVVITAGFRETGPEGEAAEHELVAAARKHRIRLVGPNSVGVINTAIGMNATFAEAAPLHFGVSMLSQSGAVATAILDWARSIGLGFAKFVSLGNMADLNDVDFLEYLGSDAETKIVVVYLEGISDGRRLLKVARRVSAVKPVVMIKVGATSSGARAARSHTGALASTEAVVAGALRQAGIVRATTMAELFDYTLCFSYAPLPRGSRVAVVTNAGGPGVMVCDALERLDLELATFSPSTIEQLAERLAPAAAKTNPVDLLGDAGSDSYQAALELVLADEGVDSVLALLTPQRLTEPERTARVISYLARDQEKPVFAVLMGGEAVERGRKLLDEARVPVYAYPERAVRALSAMVRYSTYRGAIAPDVSV
jgi:acetyltransferase